MFTRFLKDLIYILPCKTCSGHFKYILNHTNLSNDNRIALVELLREKVKKYNVKPMPIEKTQKMIIKKTQPIIIKKNHYVSNNIRRRPRVSAFGCGC